MQFVNTHTHSAEICCVNSFSKLWLLQGSDTWWGGRKFKSWTFLLHGCKFGWNSLISAACSWEGAKQGGVECVAVHEESLAGMRERARLALQPASRQQTARGGDKLRFWGQGIIQKLWIYKNKNRHKKGNKQGVGCRRWDFYSRRKIRSKMHHTSSLSEFLCAPAAGGPAWVGEGELLDARLLSLLFSGGAL